MFLPQRFLSFVTVGIKWWTLTIFVGVEKVPDMKANSSFLPSFLCEKLENLVGKSENLDWIHFWWRFQLTEQKALMSFHGRLHTNNTAPSGTECALPMCFNPPNPPLTPPTRIAVRPTHRWLGCRRTFSGGSRTSGPPRDRSARWRRRRTSCWRSWTLPGHAWEKPATCWRPCRWSADFVVIFRPTKLWTWTTNANGMWEPPQS